MLVIHKVQVMNNLDNEIIKVIKENDISNLKQLSSENFPNGRHFAGDPWIHLAVLYGKDLAVAWMIKEGVDLKMRHADPDYDDHHTLLTMCVDGCLSEKAKSDRKIQETYLKIIHILVDAGCDINEEGWQLMTPLHYAIFGHNAEMAKELLSLGADPSVFCSIDNMGTAYNVAKEENMMHVFEGYNNKI